ncbi:NADH:flavin oxidoreductase/NADH oxidase [Dietzia massiliensis]|uniref:NADH:flavin oxidoreductase/NADH oxidase n=1 Tax=Dietzia massiliensis TaxID=2697499 RepID=UPI001BCC3835|nr:NADH:flavin oxidoreductase/NADH oxidase [Dietzia massiliensis]MBS7549388.1 NADH:flavin oxidoreductase/NADH oxidase [Dietzia massiliensis]
MALLFEPIRIRDLEIRNRAWLSPMCQYSCEDRDGVPTPWHLVHLGARAQGGFGLILAEASAVVPEGRISPEDAGLWNDAQRDAWAPIVDFAHSQGAAIGIQLAHAGRKASAYRAWPGYPVGSMPVDEGGWTTVAPSAIPFGDMATPEALDADGIRAVVGAFADAARRADQAGFDVVEIHAAHGYLLHEFLSPLSNERTDSYGGSRDNRARLLLEVCDAVREVWPEGKPLFVRISATDWVPGGWTPEDSRWLAGRLAEHGVDLVDVSSAANTPDRPPVPLEQGYQVPLTEEVRASGAVLAGAVGLISDPEYAESLLVDGRADVVFLGRVALREPAWPQRAAAELGLDWREAPYPPQYTRGKWD